MNIENTQKILHEIIDSNNYKRLNHIGFCYQVNSVEKEIKRLTEIMKISKFNLFQEPSSDSSSWLFIGDISQIDSPLIEILLNEGDTGDRWEKYWLPHIQVDIDTKLSPTQTEKIVQKYTNSPEIPYSIKINNICHIQRVRLGIINGVNINLDISTKNRDINYRKGWERL